MWCFNKFWKIRSTTADFLDFWGGWIETPALRVRGEFAPTHSVSYLCFFLLCFLIFGVMCCVWDEVGGF